MSDSRGGRSLKSTLVDFEPPADSEEQFIHSSVIPRRHSLMNYLRKAITSARANNLIGADSYFMCVICAPTKLSPTKVDMFFSQLRKMNLRYASYVSDHLTF